MAAGTSLKELLYLKALEAAGVGVWEWDIATNHLEWSTEHYKLFGKAPFSITPDYEQWESQVHPEDLPGVQEAIRGALEHGTEYDARYRILLADGSYRWILGRGKAEYSDSGEPVRMNGTVMDVTAQQTKARANEKSFLTYALALEAGNLGIFEYDPITQHIEWSDSYFKIFGYPAPFEPKPHHWLDRIHPDDLPHFEKRYQQLIGKVPELRLEYRIVWPDGSIHWIESRMHCQSEEGNPIRIFGVAIDITDRKVGERERQKIQEKMELAVETGRMAIFDYDYDSGEFFWSEENFKIFGYDEPVKPSYEAWLDRVHPDDRERLKAHSLAGRSSTDTMIDEYRVVLPDGSVRWLESRSRYELKSPGVPRRIFGITIDINERKRREIALENSQATLGLALEASRVGTYSIDYVNQQVHLSERAAEMFGFQDNPSPTLSDLRARYHPQDERTLSVARTTRSPANPTFRTQTRILANGSYRWMETRGTYSFDENAKPLYLTAVAIDVDEQKKAEVEVRDSEEKFRVMADQSPVMMFASDREFKATYLNSKWGDFTGESPESSYGEGWQRLIHPDDVDRLVDEVGRSSVEPFHVEYRLRRSDGEYRWCAAIAAPNFSKDGEMLGRIGSIYDIHDAKVLREELEANVRHRTEELIAANKEMEGFTYTVAHDLRTPLRAITSNSRILLEDYLDDLPQDAQLMLHRQADAATRMGMLIDDLLQYSRIGRGELQRLECDLGQIADAAMQEVITDHPAELEFAKNGNLTAICDPRLMQMVLTNLFSNSIKFRHPDRPLSISLDMDEHWSERRFVVSDNGVGFDQQYVGKIFLPFERLVRNEEFPGTGIGLANVARIIRRHGGRIWAEGKLGEGATFTFTLP